MPITHKNRSVDILLLGGGLSNLLTAWFLWKRKISINWLLIESSSQLGTGRTWSFHDFDLNESQLEIIKPWIHYTWNSHQVIFPQHRRTLNSKYHTIKAAKLGAVLPPHFLANCLLNTEAQISDHTRVTLSDGTILSAKIILDGRNLSPTQLKNTNCFAYQKFVGLQLKLAQPHFLTKPILMDACVEQKEGYRFFYCLPFSEDTILIEDTRYSNQQVLNIPEFEKEIINYAQQKNWQILEILEREQGVLPLVKNPKYFNKIKNETTGHLPVGIQAGFFNWITGYSFAQAVLWADEFTQTLVNSQADATTAPQKLRFICLHQWQKFRRSLGQQNQFFLLLNLFLFRAARPQQRVGIFARFYQLNETLIQSFYAAKLSRLHQLRILSGRPPIGIFQAILAVFRWLAILSREFLK